MTCTWRLIGGRLQKGEGGQNSLTRFGTFSKIQQRRANMLRGLICVPKMRPNRNSLFSHEGWHHRYLFPASIEPYSSTELLNVSISITTIFLTKRVDHETNLNDFRCQLRFDLNFLQPRRWTRNYFYRLSFIITVYESYNMTHAACCLNETISPFPFRWYLSMVD